MAHVVNVKTGEVLAMANQPTYNPNRIQPGQQDRFRNRAVTDSFEPGSTIKTFSMASALYGSSQKGLWFLSDLVAVCPH